MVWMAAAPAIASVAGGVIGKLMEGDRNIDKSPGMQQTTKDMLLAAYPEVIRSLQMRPDIQQVGMSPFVAQGAESIGRAVEGMGPQIEAAQGAWQTGLGAPDIAQNPYMQGILSSIREQGGRLFREEINPALRRSSIAGGMYGGGRSGVNQGIAAGKVAQGVSDAQRQAMMQGYGQGLTHQANLLGMSPQMAGLGMLPGQTLMQTGVGQMGAEADLMRNQLARQTGMQNLRFNPMQQWIGSHSNMWGSGAPQQYPQASGAAQGAGWGAMAGGVLGQLGKMFGDSPNIASVPSTSPGYGQNYGQAIANPRVTPESLFPSPW